MQISHKLAYITDSTQNAFISHFYFHLPAGKSLEKQLKCVLVHLKMLLLYSMLPEGIYFYANYFH